MKKFKLKKKYKKERMDNSNKQILRKLNQGFPYARQDEDVDLKKN